MKEILSNYIPNRAVEGVLLLLEKHPITIKIVNNRNTKHGDFRKLKNGNYQITINNTLNKYQFLLTLIHEIAHFATYKKYRKVKPHGNEWKQVFQHLMLPFLHPEIFSPNMLPHLATYLKNPKASTSSDIKLSLAFKEFDKNSGKNYIFELPTGSIFTFNNKTYKIGNKRRTRYECIELKSYKRYLFNQNTEIEKVETD